MVGGIKAKKKEDKTLIWGAVENSGRADLVVVCVCVVLCMSGCENVMGVFGIVIYSNHACFAFFSCF